MIEREIKRQNQKIGKYVEPLLIFVLILLFTAPILSVINLSPKTRNSQPIRENVLGVQDENVINVNGVGGFHSIITAERLNKQNDTHYSYKAQILPYAAGSYSKPIIEIVNSKNIDIEAELAIDPTINTQSAIGVIIKDTNYILKDSEGYTFPRKIAVKPGERTVIYLSIQNKSSSNFTTAISIDLTISAPANL